MVRTLVLEKDDSGYLINFDLGKGHASEPSPLYHRDRDRLRKLVAAYKKEGMPVKNGNLDGKVFDYVVGNINSIE